MVVLTVTCSSNGCTGRPPQRRWRSPFFRDRSSCRILLLGVARQGVEVDTPSGNASGGGADDSVGDHVVLQYKLSFLDDIIVMKYFTF